MESISSMGKMKTIALSIALAAGLAACASTGPVGHYQTKTPYAPHQDMATYEKAPDGYKQVLFQGAWRHGSRGLSSPKYDLVMYEMWKQAKKDGGLTALGEELGPKLVAMTKANAVLGYGVEGVKNPGYGNLTSMGMLEHQGMGKRTATRLNDYFKKALGEGRKLVMVNSGQDRARESGENYIKGFFSVMPEAKAALVLPPAPGPFADQKPGKLGSDVYMLYSQKMKKDDKIAEVKTEPYYSAWKAGMAYLKYRKDPDYKAAQKAVEEAPWAQGVAREVMETLFTKAFLDKLDKGGYHFTNAVEGSVTTPDGKFTKKYKGNGETKIASSVDAVSMLYELYIIGPSITPETGVSFNEYITPKQALELQQIGDGDNFYKQGPSLAESKGVTWKITQYLLDDFFAEVDKVAKGDKTAAAKIRFAHAEQLIPFATILGIKDAATPLPKSVPYSYKTSNWRGEYVTPMAANVQWDVYANDKGGMIVKMLHHEKETDFKPECDSAKIKPDSKFYDYKKLRACYGYK